MSARSSGYLARFTRNVVTVAMLDEVYRPKDGDGSGGGSSGGALLCDIDVGPGAARAGAARALVAAFAGAVTSEALEAALTALLAHVKEVTSGGGGGGGVAPPGGHPGLRGIEVGPISAAARARGGSAAWTRTVAGLFGELLRALRQQQQQQGPAIGEPAAVTRGTGEEAGAAAEVAGAAKTPPIGSSCPPARGSASAHRADAD